MTCGSCSSTKSERLDSPRRMASMCAETTTKPAFSSANRSISTTSSLLLRTAMVIGPGILLSYFALGPRPLHVRRHEAGRVAERQSEGALECHISRLEEPGNANRDRRLREIETQAAMHAVPARQQAREVRVRFLGARRVMDAVHPRRHDDRLQSLLDIDGQVDVAVVKDHREQQALLPDAQGLVIDAEQQDLGGPKPRGERELAEVEADAGAAIQVEIDVVNGVKTPERRGPVIQPVPDVERVVEEQESEDDSERARKGQHAQEPDLTARREPLHRSDKRHLARGCRGGGKQADRQIAADTRRRRILP